MGAGILRDFAGLSNGVLFLDRNQLLLALDCLRYVAYKCDVISLRDELAPLVSAAAAQGVFMGTSSWKYPGWTELLYEEQRYLWHGKFSNSRFERSCLEEYSQVFPTVCVDAAYYKFPEAKSLIALAKQVPASFRFSFKVTQDITVKRFPNIAHYGPRAGKENPFFLDPSMFIHSFLAPCEAIRDQVGMLIFEFSPFHLTDFARGREFVQALDSFLGCLPKGWNYGVEIRNRTFLHPEYFAMLAKHEVTHVFNSWTDMPGLEEQWNLVGSVTRPEVVGARLLLKPGRKYQTAVESFSPYNQTKEILPTVRETAAKMVQRGATQKKPSQTFIYVNNRLEGNALHTVKAILDQSKLRVG